MLGQIRVGNAGGDGFRQSSDVIVISQSLTAAQFEGRRECNVDPPGAIDTLETRRHFPVRIGPKKSGTSRELTGKRTELAALESQLPERVLDLVTWQAEIRVS